MPPQAERIRSLVNVARGCIIEIGLELIQAKSEFSHGGWLPWLNEEFGWSEMTAQRYMRVADAFKSNTLLDFNSLTIDTTALYALAAPDVPQAAREEAIDRAQTGEHITKAEAERNGAVGRCCGIGRWRRARGGNLLALAACRRQ